MNATGQNRKNKDKKGKGAGSTKLWRGGATRFQKKEKEIEVSPNKKIEEAKTAFTGQEAELTDQISE